MQPVWHSKIDFKEPGRAGPDFARLHRAGTARLSRGRFAFCNLHFAICIFLVCVVQSLATTNAHACNVPVFRYALERWIADPFEVVVFHRGALAEKDRASVEALERLAERQAAPANVRVARVDLEQSPDPEMQQLFEKAGSAELPWAVVRHPQTSNINRLVWSGKFSDLPIKTLVESPVRSDIVRRLLGGQTAVWVLLESGNKEADDAAAALLDAELKKLPLALTLPELTDDPEDKLAGDRPPPRIEFSLVRLSRSDKAEELLARMLLDAEDDLLDRTEPLVFPVFGRGRALFPLVGAGITDENIKDTAAFLVGPCSCIVKRLNPGIDLLFAADWGPVVPDEASEIASSPTNEPVYVPLPEGPQSVVAVENASVSGATVNSSGGPSRQVVIGAIVALTALGLLAGFAFMRSSASTKGSIDASSQSK